MTAACVQGDHAGCTDPGCWESGSCGCRCHLAVLVAELVVGGFDVDTDESGRPRIRLRPGQRLGIVVCGACGRPWGRDPSCASCTDDDGRPRPPPRPGG